MPAEAAAAVPLFILSFRHRDELTRIADRQIAPHSRDAIAVDQQVEHAVASVRRVDQAAALQQ